MAGRVSDPGSLFFIFVGETELNYRNVAGAVAFLTFNKLKAFVFLHHTDEACPVTYVANGLPLRLLVKHLVSPFLFHERIYPHADRVSTLVKVFYTFS